MPEINLFCQTEVFQVPMHCAQAYQVTLNILHLAWTFLNAEKSVGGHIKKSVTSSILTESHFAWQLDVEGFIK